MARGMGSVGGAAAEGLSSGIGLGLRLRDQTLQEEDTARRTRRQDEQDTWAREDRARKLADDEDDRALKALDSQYESLRGEGDSYVQQYGANVPEEIGADYKRRVKETTGLRDQLQRKRYEPVLRAAEKKRDEMVSRFKTGQLDPMSVGDRDFYDFVTASARRDPRDFLSANGKPSRVGQATTDIMTGIETGNEQMTLAGANVLLEPELKIGVGETSPHGGKIVGKEIVKMIPDPNRDGFFMPVVKVYVKQGGKQAGPNLENGATGYYLAPITENRSSDPEDTVKSIDLKQAMDYAAQAQTFSTLLDKPELRAKIERGAKESETTPSSFLQAFYAVKGKMPAKQVTWQNVPAGGVAVGFDPQGREIGRIEGPKKSATGLGGQIDAIEQFAAENGLSFDEAAARMQSRGLLRAPGKGAKGGGGGGGGGGSTGMGGGAGAKNAGLTGEEFLKTLPADEQRIVKGLADGSIKPSEISMKGDRRERLLAKAKQYEATADLSGKDGGFKNENALRDEFQKASGDFVKIRNAYGLVNAAAKDPSAAGDMALIFSFMRILDPNSVVREGEFATAQNAAGVPDRIVNTYNRLLKGERLGESQRADFVNQAKKIYDEQKQQNDGLAEQYRGMAKRYKLNPENIVTSFERKAAPAPAAGGMGGGAKTATNPKTGEKLVLKDGQWVPLKQ